MPVRARPTSPHLDIYRWDIVMCLSILHRITGVALAFGILALTYWLVAIAGGEDSYTRAHEFFAGPVGMIMLVGWTFCFLYHLLNGVRHLFWDAGYGFERAQRRNSGWASILGAVALTVCVWVVVWHGAHV